MTTPVKSLVISLAALMALPWSAQAVMGNLATETPQPAPAALSPSAAAPPAPAAHSVGDIPVISGGIGDDMPHLLSVQHEYNLKLTFTENNGLYLADVPVSITDKHGRIVLETVSDGPVMLTKLPAGTYTVKASQEKQSKQAKVTVGASLSTYQFRFPTVDENPQD